MAYEAKLCKIEDAAKLAAACLLTAEGHRFSRTTAGDTAAKQTIELARQSLNEVPIYVRDLKRICSAMEYSNAYLKVCKIHNMQFYSIIFSYILEHLAFINILWELKM